MYRDIKYFTTLYLTCIKQLNFPKVNILYVSKNVLNLVTKSIETIIKAQWSTALHRGHIQFWPAKVSRSPTALYCTKSVTFKGIILKQQIIQRKRLLYSILEIIEPDDTTLYPKTLSIIQNIRHIIEVNKAQVTWICQITM